MSTIVQQHAPLYVTGKRTAYTSLRILLGSIWLLNAWFQLRGWLLLPHGQAAANLLHDFSKPIASAPIWLQGYLDTIVHGIHMLGPDTVGAAMVTLDLLLALSLMFGVRVRQFCWLGILYSLFCWTTLDTLGFPYSNGQTDPGVFVNYMLAFFFVLSALPRGESDAASKDDTARADPFVAGRVLFGLLWLFDAILKWQPAFLHHFMDQLVPAMQGQPGWIAAFIQFVISIVHFIGPYPVAIVVAVVETLIAASLLSGRGLKLFVPIGLLYSLAVWMTAEGWGGPYTAAGTGVRGNVLGNVIIYAFIFAYLWVQVRPLAHREQRQQVKESEYLGSE
ncbi:MAG: hypothetical protein P8047_15490 [Gammaproteobacteria bacterium]|jgi:uncharacterized membrane protein YphA (DoxX/SURF4 family)